MSSNLFTFSATAASAGPASLVGDLDLEMALATEGVFEPPDCNIKKMFENTN